MTDSYTLRDVICEMKRKPRTGWVDHGIQNAETVWQHSYAMWRICRELATWYLGARHAKQCGRYGEVHDITEGIIPDITPYMGITVGEKRELEMMAINHIGTLSRGGQRIRNNWLEYDAGANDEALFVHGVDKLHPCYVALEYEKANVCRYSLQPFWDYAFAKIQDSPLIETWGELNKQRPPNAGDKPILERRPKPPGTFAEMKRVVEQRCGLARRFRFGCGVFCGINQ